jgi:hypothetical protein
MSAGMLPWVGSLLMVSMQDEETLRTVRQVVIRASDLMPCGQGVSAKDLNFSRFGLEGARATCDLVPTIIAIVESKDLQWVPDFKAAMEAEVRTSLSLNAHYLLHEYHREFRDKRVEEYFRRIAVDRSRHIHVRISAAGSASGMFTPAWPAFAAEALRKHRDIAASILRSLDTIHLAVPAERYRDYYTEDVAKALREYIAATPEKVADSEGARWTKALAEDLDAGRIPRPQKPSEK